MFTLSLLLYLRKRKHRFLYIYIHLHELVDIYICGRFFGVLHGFVHGYPVDFVVVFGFPTDFGRSLHCPVIAGAGVHCGLHFRSVWPCRARRDAPEIRRRRWFGRCPGWRKMRICAKNG